MMPLTVSPSAREHRLNDPIVQFGFTSRLHIVLNQIDYSYYITPVRRHHVAMESCLFGNKPTIAISILSQVQIRSML